MPGSDILTNSFWAVTRRQSAVVLMIAALFAILMSVLYLLDRQREWRLRQEQAKHRLDLADEMISEGLKRVRSDALFLAQLDFVQKFVAGDGDRRDTIENEFAQFVRNKKSYDQVRLVDPSGQEQIRVDATPDGVRVIPESELQDKKDRYYVRQSLGLNPGDVFVSDFDLNQEHGAIEQPYNPVVRFVTPVGEATNGNRSLLVVNYLGAPLLRELREISLPGHTFLIRTDGHFLLGLGRNDAWGWLLGHERTFQTAYPTAWDQIVEGGGDCFLSVDGAFAGRRVSLSEFIDSSNRDSREIANRSNLLIVSYVPRSQVYSVSDQLLKRLLLTAAIMVIPVILLTRFWASAVVRRQQQNRRIVESEEKLRELSSRLLRVQEEERKAISREIHDELGQQVTAINLDLKLAQRESGSESGREQLSRAIRENEQLLSTLHDFSRRVRPAVLDDLGLYDAIESHIWEFETRTKISANFEAQRRDCDLPPVIAENVFRLLQEALNNVVKHANADRVDIHLSIAEKPNAQPRMTMQVTDNGQGVVPSDPSSSRLGLIGMRERVDLLNGTIKIDSNKTDGTRITVCIPLETKNQSLDASNQA